MLVAGRWRSPDPDWTMARLIAYVREPRSRQDEGLEALDRQREVIDAWAAARRHQIVATIEEAGPSLDDRPALGQALLALTGDGCEGVVVASLAGLHPDLVAQEQILQEFRRIGARVYTLEPDEASALRARPVDPERKLVRQVLRAAAANEPSIMALRSAARSSNGGSPPYGYQMEDGKLVPHPEEQQTLARIAELRGEGRTLREVARVLDAEGHRAKRAGKWHPETLRRITARSLPSES